MKNTREIARKSTTVLVRAPNWTGDVIMATPGFRALRQGLPDARITVHVRPELAPLLDGAPWFDEVLPLHARRRGARAWWAEAQRLRRRNFDLGVCLPDSFSAALLMRLGGVRHVVGYRRNARGALLHHGVPAPGDGGRVMVAREQHVLGLVSELGCAEHGTQLELFVTPAEQAEADAALAAAGIPPEAPLAALAPGASYGPAKLWPAESFARVGEKLAAAGARVVVLGAPGERALAATVCGSMSGGCADLCGAVGIGALKAVLRRTRVLVCNDAGARHVAVAFGVPCVVMMGPTALEKTNWNLERVQVLTADVPCRPCYRRVCPIDHRCMTRIEPERAAEAALAVLATGRAGEPLAGSPA